MTREEVTSFGSSGESEVSFSEDSDFLVLMAEAASAVLPAPRRALKTKIMTAVAESDSEDSAKESTAGTVIRASEGRWIESGIEGITMKLLHEIENSSVEAGHKRYSVLARLAKGARYPHHRHVGYEECLLLEGDLRLNDLTLRAGDYITTPDGAEHFETYTENGCLLMLSTQLEDEILAF